MKKLFYLVLGLFIAKLIFGSSVNAQTQEELQRQISEYQAKIIQLQAQANSLNNQIAQFDAQIRLTELKIQQTLEQIDLLGGRIDEIEISLSSLTDAFSARVIQTYKMSRTAEPLVVLLGSDSLSSAVSQYHYLQKIQSADRDLMLRLQNTQNIYIDQKGDLEDLQLQLEKQQSQLANEKAAKANLLAVTKNDEARYQQLLKEAQAQLAAFRRFVSGQGGASILNNQTKCDGWGCYYNQRDSQWGNQAIGLSSSSMAEYGCLITSMAMISSHYGKSLKPSDIAATPSVFVGSTAYMLQGTWTASGVSTTRTRVCSGCSLASLTSQMDAELSQGKPVIVGLYSGPDHFIVIKAKNGDQYVMNDPFLENGGDRPLTDKYNLSDIKTLDIVRVN